MGGIFGGGSSVNLQAPPPPPAQPALRPEERRALEAQTTLFEENLEVQRRMREEEAATRAAVEEALGIPFDQLVAQQAVDEFSLLKNLRGQQEQSLQRVEEEREAFIQATGITPEQFAGEEAERQLVLSRALHERFQKALRGELEIDPSLEMRLGQEAEQLEEQYRRMLGPGYQASSPYIQARAEMQEKHQALRHGAARGEITRAEQIGFGLSPALDRELRTQQGLMAGLPAGSPFDFSRNLSQLDRSFFLTPPQAGPLMQEGQFSRGLEARSNLAGFLGQLDFTRQLNQANIEAASARTQAQAGLLGALIQAGGKIGGAAI